MKTDRKNFLWAVVLGMSIGVLVGVLIGIQIQQMIFIVGMVEFGESLEGTNIEVNIDLNETQLVEGFTKFFNESFQEELK